MGFSRLKYISLEEKTMKTEKYVTFLCWWCLVLPARNYYDFVISSFICSILVWLSLKNNMWQHNNLITNEKKNQHNINCRPIDEHKNHGMRQMFARFEKTTTHCCYWHAVCNSMANWQKYAFHKCPLSLCLFFRTQFQCRDFHRSQTNKQRITVARFICDYFENYYFYTVIFFETGFFNEDTAFNN